MDMNGRNVFLTGASSGIGRATAVVFAQAGARVALCARSVDKLRALELLYKHLGLGDGGSEEGVVIVDDVGKEEP